MAVATAEKPRWGGLRAIPVPQIIVHLSILACKMAFDNTGM